MKRVIIVLFIFFSACTESNILVIPKNNQGGYCVAKTQHNVWAGYKSITLIDDQKNTFTCSGEHRIFFEESYACEDKEYQAHLKCLNDTKVYLRYKLNNNCKEAYGVALLSTGEEYEVYIGISDKLMIEKINAYESLEKNKVGQDV